MKHVALLFILFCASVMAHAQMVSGAGSVVTVYSQNEQFYLQSTSYDDESPSLRGQTSVYQKDNPIPLYTLERGFDVIQANTLVLSNDAETIFMATTWAADEEKDGMKSISVYKHGQLVRSYTESEVTGCDKNKERCQLVYDNTQQVLDLNRNEPGKFFKPGVDEKERFLNDFPIFSFDDSVYLIDSKKQLHTFDLKEARFVRTESFDNVYEQLKTKARDTKIESRSYRVPRFADFPKLANGSDTATALAEQIGMQASRSQDDARYKLYTVVFNGLIRRDGGLEIEQIEVDPGLPKDKIVAFFSTQKFDSSPVPPVFAKWQLRDEFFYFRNKNPRQAQLEKRQQDRAKEREYERRLTLDTINGVYIPANLRECFVELDKQLPEVDRNEMRALPKPESMIRYHHSLGMWMRNNWGLWGGSRLQKYFQDRGVVHPDDMSGVILEHYYDWLNDKKDTWKNWEMARKPHR